MVKSSLALVGRAVALAAALLPGAQAVSAAPAKKDVVAELGSTQLSSAELRDYVGSLQPDMRKQALGDPTLMSRLVQLEIIRKAVLKEALAKKWQQRPEVARQIAVMRDAIVLKAYLASAVTVPEPSEKEIQAAYDLNRDKFMVGRQYRLAQIFIASPKGDTNGAVMKKKASDLAAKARSGKFEDLAKRNSQHKTSAARGGDMGWLIETQILPEIRNRVAGMTRGDVSDPVRSEQGWHVIRLLDTKPAAPRPLGEVKSLIATSLRQKRQQDEEQQYIVRMLQKTPVTVNEPQLRAALDAPQ
jgi:peptidylprolyl isomerase